MRTSIATVCLSGTLTDKLHAAAEAGFDGVEIFEPDLVASPASPEEIAALAARLGLTLDLYQPFRDAEGVTEAEFDGVLRRARAKFALMQRLGIDTMLVCSNVATATLDDDEVSASQLRRLGEEAAAHGVRIAYEALAWGRFVDDYRRAWRIVELADHPAVGICLDSFHILSRGHDPAAIEEIPGDEDLLPPARGRAGADHGRAVLVAAPPAVPRRGRLRPRHVRRPRPARGVRRAALARGLQRHLPADRRRPDRPAGTALAHLAGGHRRRGAGTGTWPRRRRGRAAARRGRTVRLRLRRGAGRGHRRGRRPARAARASPSGAGTAARTRGCGPRGARAWSATSSTRATGPRPWRPWGSRSRIRRRRPRGPARSRRRPSTAVPSPTSRSSRRSAPPTAPRSSSAPSPRRRTPPGSPSSRAASRARRPLLTGIDHVNLAEPWQCFDEAVLFYSSLLGLAADASQEVAVAQRAGAQPGRPLGLRRVPARPQRRAAGLGHPAASRSTWPSRTDDVVAVARARHRPRARPARHPAELLRRPDGPLRPHRPGGRDHGRPRAPPRPRRRRRLHALLHRHHRRRLLRGGPAARRATTDTAPRTPAFGSRPSTAMSREPAGARRHRC